MIQDFLSLRRVISLFTLYIFPSKKAAKNCTEYNFSNSLYPKEDQVGKMSSMYGKT
jgi:hypothetical protein